MSTKANTDATHTQTSASVMRHLLYGRLVTSDFFARNWLLLTLSVFLILAYIAGKYSCMAKMEEVRRLTSQVEVTRAEMVRTRSLYMSNIRESAMQQMVDTLHLDLHVQQHPPYKLLLDK